MARWAFRPLRFRIPWRMVADELASKATCKRVWAQGRHALPQRLLNECVADAAGDIPQLASVAGVSAVAELSASVADEAVAELADDKSLLKGRVPQVDD